jgi:hypothetical protein
MRLFDNALRKTNVILLLIFVILGFFSCKNSKRKAEAEKIVKEWIGKEIQFSEDAQCCILGTDATPDLCAGLFDREYKIFLYVDSTGCSSCRLRLLQWKQLIEEADSLFEEKLGFLFFFQPKSKKDMEYLFKNDQFDYPVFIEMNDAMNQINHFPAQAQYQCFLLNKENKVLMIGNPMINPKIWELYKEQISGEKKATNELLTSIKPDKMAFDFGNIRKGSKNKVAFTIENTGENPLIISRVTASCGCANVEWDKQPIEPGQTAKVRVEMTPEEIGHFEKTIEVYCNAKESPVKLTITGVATK